MRNIEDEIKDIRNHFNLHIGKLQQIQLGIGVKSEQEMDIILDKSITEIEKIFNSVLSGFFEKSYQLDQLNEMLKQEVMRKTDAYRRLMVKTGEFKEKVSSLEQELQDIKLDKLNPKLNKITNPSKDIKEYVLSAINQIDTMIKEIQTFLFMINEGKMLVEQLDLIVKQLNELYDVLDEQVFIL